MKTVTLFEAGDRVRYKDHPEFTGTVVLSDITWKGKPCVIVDWDNEPEDRDLYESSQLTLVKPSQYDYGSRTTSYRDETVWPIT